MTRGTKNRMAAFVGIALGVFVFTAAATGQTAAGWVPRTPDEYGTTVSGYSAYDGDQFRGRSSTYSYTCDSCIGAGEVYFTGGDNLASVQIEMPSGSSFKGVRWWGFDNADPQNLSFFVTKTCLPANGAGSPAFTQLQDGYSSGTPGDTSGFINVAGLETVDNEACTYRITIRFDVVGNTLRLYKVRALWERQVSPAPAVATFNDVPTDHPFFQYIEALSASYITAGCNEAPPLFCPDAPLTRGQMAVFLAKALGLHWP